MSQYELKLYKISKISFFLTILVIVCELFRELDGPKAPDNLLGHAVLRLKENIVFF